MSASMRRSLAAVLVALAAALLLALGAVQPAHAATQGEWGDCTWQIKDGTLTVEGTSDGMLTGDKGSAPWKESANTTGVTKIVVGTADKPVKYRDAAVEYLFLVEGEGASVNTIDLSYFDTSNVTDMKRMFSDCKSLTTLTFPLSFNTSKVTSMNSMFAVCYDLESLDLSSFDTSSVEDMTSMFKECHALESLDLSSFDPLKVKGMGEMFFNCYALTTVDLSSFNTSQVENMGSMFSGCNALESLNLSSFNTAQVATMSSMFSNCRVLKSLDLSSFDTSQVEEMTNMFSGCQVLASLDLSNFDTSHVTSMSNMFNACKTLVTLDLSSFNTAQVTSMSSMFSGCEALVSLDLSAFNTSKVTNMSGMFDGCKKLVYPVLSSFDTSQVTKMGSMFANCGALVALDLSSFDTSKIEKYEANDMFKGSPCVAIRLGDKCKLGLYYVTLPDYEGASIEIAGTGLKTTGDWIDPQKNSHEYYADLAPSGDTVGWYLAEPASGSYALFDWGAPGEAPAFVATTAGKVTELPTLHGRSDASWYENKELTGSPVEFDTATLADKKPQSFYAKWDNKPIPTEKQFDVAPATYDGQPNAAVIKPVNGLAGKATVTSYKDSAGTIFPAENPPTKAGTYDIFFSCAAGPGYQEAPELTLKFVISLRKLSGKEVATLPNVVIGTGDTPGTNIKIKGGSIIANDAPLTATATVTHPSSGTAGTHKDASVSALTLTNNPNYDTAGLTLTGQAYTVDAHPAGYQVTEGANGSWEQGSDAGLRFSVNAEFANFRNVSVDGRLVDSSNYTAQSGSTIVILKPDYLATLAPGSHVLRLAFTDGAAETTFTVAAASKPGTDGSSGTGNQGSGGSALAPTGDAAAPLALAAFALAALAVASLAAARRARR